MTDLKRPDFVLIDEKEGRKDYSYFSSDSQERIKTWSEEKTEKRTQNKTRTSASKGMVPRLLCFSGLIAVCLIEIGALFICAIHAFFAALFLFRDHKQNIALINSLKAVGHLFFVICSAFIGIFYPSLGIGLVMAYFSSLSSKIRK